MTSANDTLYKTATGHAWVGETWAGRTPDNAAFTAQLPTAEDPRWTPGTPDVLDTEVLTLSPFSPAGRLGVCVEQKASQPLGRYPNHPPFFGCRAWMSLDAIEWRPTTPPL